MKLKVKRREMLTYCNKKITTKYNYGARVTSLVMYMCHVIMYMLFSDVYVLYIVFVVMCMGDIVMFAVIFVFCGLVYGR